MSKALDKVIAPIAEALREALRTYEATGKFRRPWKITLPYNASTLNEYRGVNIVRLMFSERDCPAWGTMVQWNNLGYRVKKGSSGAAIYSPALVTTTKDADGNKAAEYERPPRAYYVFNGADVQHAETEEPYEWKRINTETQDADCDAFFAALPITINESERACYRVKADYIEMPTFSAFISRAAYYTTLAHEVIHWSGHASRLGRAGIVQRNERNAAIEELTAEFGAALISARLNLPADEMRADHLEYLSSWADALKNDDDAVAEALKEATAAYRYVIEVVEANSLVEAV